MKQKRNTEEQIFRILKAHETGAKVPDMIREAVVAPSHAGMLRFFLLGLPPIRWVDMIS